MGQESPFVKAGKYLAVAFEFLGTIFAGAVMGYYLDRYLGTEPTMAFFFTLAGVGVGFYRLVQLLRELERRGSK